MEKEIEVIISGKVVMVMFRDFIRRKAYALNLVGTVENFDNGSVKVVAQGKEEDLEKLIEHLHKGPFLAKVARVEVKWDNPTDKYSNFTIIY